MAKPNQGSGPGRNMPDHIIENFLKIQSQKIQNEAKELGLREKELEASAKYSEKVLNHQADFLKSKPKEQRKTATRYAYIGAGFLVVFLLFCGYCLSIGKEDFVITLIQIVGYFATTALGYYFGRKSKPDPSAGNDSTQDAEIL